MPLNKHHRPHTLTLSSERSSRLSTKMRTSSAVSYEEPVSLISSRARRHPHRCPRPTLTLVPFIIHQLTHIFLDCDPSFPSRGVRAGAKAWNETARAAAEGSLDFMPHQEIYTRAAGAKLLPLSAFMCKPFSPRKLAWRRAEAPRAPNAGAVAPMFLHSGQSILVKSPLVGEGFEPNPDWSKYWNIVILYLILIWSYNMPNFRWRWLGIGIL